MFQLILRAFVLLALLSCLLLGIVGYVLYIRWFVQDMPQISTLSDYQPPSVTEVFSRDGELIAEIFVERRYPVKLSEVPLIVRNAILAAEDAAFYTHPGINPLSIIRAAFKNIESGEASQGGSTITQQVVKNLLLTPEKTFERKLKEAILSYKLEESLSKDGILEIYLNQIYFGNASYGIKAAAKEYYHKDLPDLSLAEAALLAGMPKAPTLYSPLTNFPRAKRRQQYVLHRMKEAGFIKENDYQTAIAEELVFFKSNPEARFFKAPYFLRELKDQALKALPAGTDIERAGLKIISSLDLQFQEKAEIALRDGLRKVDKRIGWRGPVGSGYTLAKFLSMYQNPDPLDRLTEPTVVLVEYVDRSSLSLKVRINQQSTGVVDLRDSIWSTRKLYNNDQVKRVSLFDEIKSGDLIEVTGATDELKIDQTPSVEGAFTLLNHQNGEVLAMVGGYDYRRAEFNRATQAERQPGSAFKPFVYLAALKEFGYTPATIVHDEPRTFRVGTEVWSPKNYDNKFMGSITLQKALEQSRNIVVVDLVSRFGVAPVIALAKLMGISSPLGNNLSLALGTSEVNLLELVRAYGVFGNSGRGVPSSLIKEARDRFGRIIYSNNEFIQKNTSQVIPSDVAFVTTKMLQGVVERGTATQLKSLKVPIAGKTGTTNDHMDTWFIGFNPQFSAGVWVGYDQKKSLGPKETGGKVAVPIWGQVMEEVITSDQNREEEEKNKVAKSEAENLGIKFIPSKKRKSIDFVMPKGVISEWINKRSGLRASAGDPDAIKMYFLENSKLPEQQSEAEAESSALRDYLEFY